MKPIVVIIAVIAQELLPSQAPYTILDYGVSAITLVVLGIALWYVFKTQRTILADHDKHEAEMVDTMRDMKDGLLTLVADTRHLHELVATNDTYTRTQEVLRETRLNEDRHVQQEHREQSNKHVEEATRHVKDQRRKPPSLEV